MARIIPTLPPPSSLPLFQVHAFSTSRLGGGNPAAVALLDREVADVDRQLIAADLNLSETAFVEPLDPHNTDFKSADQFKLRWFTPTTEVPMCGHATLASAAVLFQELQNPSPALRFHTQSGVLTVRRTPGTKEPAATGASGLQMQMSLPIAVPEDPLPPPLDAGTDTQGARALTRACVGDLQVCEYAYTGWNNLNYLVLRLTDGTTRQQLEAIQPDSQAMLAAAPAQAGGLHGVIVTCHGGDSGFDFLSRFFAPWMGIPEDPVTGSAHAVLGPFWSTRLQGKGSLSYHATPDMTKESAAKTPTLPLRARQCSARGGDLEVTVMDGIGEVVVGGSAVVVLRGTLSF